MPRSKHHHVLQKEIQTLRGQFLPDPFDPLGKYPRPRSVQANARAFLVLCHAEIESYLEMRAKEVARQCERVWTSKGRVTKPFIFLWSAFAQEISIPQDLAKDSPSLVHDEAKQVFQRYYKSVKSNHGIKEANFTQLFFPLGLPAAELPATLLPNLDSLGAARGDHAHQSAQAVQSVLDPETEFNRVLAVVTDLEPLDEWIGKYKRSIR